MEFGRLPDVARVDFTLPSDATANERWLGGEPCADPVLRLGLAGWADKGFVGKLYPRGTPSRAFLEVHARAFPTNELNSTYYGVSAERIERWRKAVPAGFRFCPKLPGPVTHEGRLGGERGEMEAFVAACAGFGETLGRVWGVLPPGFGPERLPELEDFLRRFAGDLSLALELRHPVWFRDPGALEAAFALFEAHGVVTILTDVAGRRDVLHMRLSAPEVFLRFVGNGGHPTDLTRLDEWAARLNDWFARGLRGGHVFLHQKQDPDAVLLARHLAERLGPGIGTDLLPGLARAERDVREPKQETLF